MNASIMPNDKLTGRQQCGGKPSKNYNIYEEDSVSKNAALLAVGWSVLLAEIIGILF
jgi:hypothetical protein